MKYKALLIAMLALGAPAGAEVIAASPQHYTLKHEASSALPADEMWDRLLAPETWWSSDHTWSGDAANLSLDAQAGGLWREDWEGGSVAHGKVLSVINGKSITLDAPFGPLQSMAVDVVWTISITPEGDGSKVTFDEVANGSAASALDAVAPAVDGVKAEALRRLTSPEKPD